MAAAVSGGTASAVGGGKFANGAATSGFHYLFVDNLDSSEGEWNELDEEAFSKSRGSYGEHNGGEVSKFNINPKFSHGFYAELTRGSGSRWFLAFRGAQMLSGADWKANIAQALGFKTSQYDQAVDLAKAVAVAIRSQGGELIFVGHSLGGGLANAAAYVTNGRAITFNAAGVNGFSSRQGAANLRSHYIRGDVLSFIQDITPGVLPSAGGVRIPHNTPVWYSEAFMRHLTGSFLGL